MKRLSLFLLILLTSFLFQSCGSGQSTPTEAVEKYTKYLIKGNIQGVVDEFFYQDASIDVAEVERGRSMVKAELEAMLPKLEALGGIKEHRVTYVEEYDDEDHIAVVDQRMIYGNEKSVLNTYRLVEREGKWYLGVMGIEIF